LGPGKPDTQNKTSQEDYFFHCIPVPSINTEITV
jgi:hypothetical protein